MTFEQAGARAHPHDVADADDGRPERSLMLQPRAEPRVVAVMHRRHDDVIGAVRMVTIEGVQRRVEREAHGGEHLHRKGTMKSVISVPSFSATTATSGRARVASAAAAAVAQSGSRSTSPSSAWRQQAMGTSLAPPKARRTDAHPTDPDEALGVPRLQLVGLVLQQLGGGIARPPAELVGLVHELDGHGRSQPWLSALALLDGEQSAPPRLP